MIQKQPRSNPHMTFNPITPMVTHLFGTPENNLPQNQLTDTLDKRALPYEFYIDYDQLQEVCQNRQGANRVVVLLTSFQNEKMLSSEMDKGLINKAAKGKVALYSYPNSIRNSGIKNLASLDQFLKIYEQRKKQKNGTIKLSAVHSISKRNASSKSITKISSDSEYRTVTFYQGYDYAVEDSYLYNKVSDILATDSHYEPFASVVSAIGKAAKEDSRGQKVLVIAPVSMGDEISKQIKKYGKEAMIDVILIGQPETNKMVLEKNIILATSSPDKLYQYLVKMFYERLVTKSNYGNSNSNGNAQGTFDPFANVNNVKIQQGEVLEYHYNNNGQIEDIKTVPKEIIANPWEQGFMGTNIQTNVQEVYVEPPKASQTSLKNSNAQQSNLRQSNVKSNGQGSEYQITSVSKIQDESDKKKVRKIKSPTKNRPASQAEINVANVSIRTPAPGPIIETNEFYTNKQGERIPKKSFTTTTTTTTTNGATAGANIRYVSPPKGLSPSHFSNQGDSQFNQMGNNNSKFKSSYIIQETSDEYRGSNKDSIVNLEPESKSKYLTTIETTGPHEEGVERRVVTNFANNYPESRYIQSSEVIKEGPRVVYNQRMPSVDEVNRNYNTITYSSQGYQSPLKVIKKGETTYPEEIKNQSLKHIEEYRGTFGANRSSNSYDKYVQPAASSTSYNYVTYNKGPTVTQTVTQSLNPQTVQTITTSKIGNTISNGKGVIGGAISNAGGSIANASNSISSVGGSLSNNIGSVSGNMGSVTVGNGGGYTVTTGGYKGGNTGVYTGVSVGGYSGGTAGIYTGNMGGYSNGNTGNIVNSSTNMISSSYSPGKVVNPSSNVSGNANSRMSQYNISRDSNAGTYNSSNSYKQIESAGSNNNNANPVTKIQKRQYNSYEITSSDPNNVVRRETAKYSPNSFNLEGYEKVEVNGIMMYRKKGEASNLPSQSNARATIKQEQHMSDSSPKVVRYQVSPRRNGETTYNTTTVQGQGIQPQRYSTYNYSSYSGRPQEKISTKEVTYYQPKSEDRVNMSNSTYNYNNFTSLPQESDKGSQNEDRFITAVSYKGGQLKDKIEVTRREFPDHKLQMANPNSRALNDSNWQSKPSDLYSDGSILRRNNIRFGVNIRKKEQKLNDLSVNESKMLSGLFKVKDLNKKMALNRVIVGEEELAEQQGKYLQINPWICSTHFLIQQDLRYLQKKLMPIFGTNDKIDSFNCLEELFQKANAQLDCGFIIVSEGQGKKINASLIPEDYYRIVIDREEPLLQINESTKQIKTDSFQRLTLAQKIILDSKLYQYVSFTGGDALVEETGDKFANSEYITQKLQIGLSCEMLDCYYYEQPRLTRVYFICLQNELASVLPILESYEQMNPAFNRNSCKILCPLQPEAGAKRLRTQYPSVVFLENVAKMSYKDIVNEAHRGDRQVVLNIKLDRLYVHEKHELIAKEVEREFPGRFQFAIFKNVAELAKRIVNYRKGDFNSYLVLHESSCGEKIAVDNFTRVFMMGRAKTIPNGVVRVMKAEELIELLKK